MRKRNCLYHSNCYNARIQVPPVLHASSQELFGTVLVILFV